MSKRGPAKHSVCKRSRFTHLLPACLAPQLFAQFTCPADEDVTFGLPLAAFLDTLSVFASGSARVDMTLTWPGPNSELLME